MQIINNENEFKILIRTRIQKKKYTTKTGEQYQYTATLPVFLVELFQVEKVEKKEGFISFEFYKWNYKTCLDLSKVVNTYEWENYSTYIDGVYTRAYSLESGTYKIGLSRKFFEELDPSHDMDLLYIVHTDRTRFNNVLGLVEVQIIHNDMEE